MIPFLFPGLLQPFSKKTGQKSKKKQDIEFKKKNPAYQVRGGNTKCKLPYKTKLTI